MIRISDLLDGIQAKALLLASGLALGVILVLTVSLAIVQRQRDAARAELRRIQDQAVALEVAVREAQDRAQRERDRTERVLSELQALPPALTPSEAARRAREIARRIR